MNELNPSRKPAARMRFGGLLALFLLADLLGLAAPLHAQNPPTYLFQIDASAVPGGMSPQWVAVDTSSNIYVTDGLSNQVVKFNASGAYLTKWGSYGSGGGQFGKIAGIAVDSSNNVYVVDSYNFRIQKFSSSGAFLAAWGSYGTGNGQLSYPQCIAVNGSGSIYVSDSGNNRIEEFNGSGVYLSQWGTSGSGNSQFNIPVGIAVDGTDYVYVADEGNYRIEKFSGSGVYLTQWGTSGSGNGQFADDYGPQGVAVDASDNVYVADEENYRVEEFNSSGGYLTQWGGLGVGGGQFSVNYGPFGITMDRSGNLIYVTDGNSRIQVFVINTNIIPPFVTQQPLSEAVPLGTNITLSIGVIGGAPLAYQWFSNSIAIFEATNATLTLADVSSSISGAAFFVLVTNAYGGVLSSNAVLTVLPAAEFLTPAFLFSFDVGGVSVGMAVDQNDNDIYSTDYSADAVGKYDNGGNTLTSWGGYGSGNSQFNYPECVAVDTDHNVYVTDYYNDRVQKFNSNGIFLTKWGSSGVGNGQFDGPVGIITDTNENVYVVDGVNNRVEKFNSSGVFLSLFGVFGTGNGQFSSPAGITVDHSNYIYVTDAGNSRVEKFDHSGNYLAQWGSFGAGNGQFNQPWGMAVDANNNIYVADEYNGRIEKFDATGNYLAQWSSPLAVQPVGVALDGTGNFIYVLDFQNGIGVFAYDTNIVAPIIIEDPLGQTVPAGSEVTLSFSVAGRPPFVYQWTSNNAPVPGATNGTLTLDNVSVAESATYVVLVTNNSGSATSGNAVLTVVPAFVNTVAVSGISISGAVLNGQVSVGEDTVVWFNWGADTNYGNRTQMTVAPGGSDTNVSAALNGLSPNFYHYQIVASNISGVVYGNDEPFTVGLAPTAVTLNFLKGSNGPTLTGSVTPNGFETTVYFEWGTYLGALTNLTMATNIGSGTNLVNISAVISGLAPVGDYSFRIVASNALGEVLGTASQFYGSSFANVPNENWDSVVSSADGSVLVAVANSANGASPAGPILISTNSGATWSIATGAPTNGLWETVACSADGSKIIAAGGGGGRYIFPIYTSPDRGVTWVSNNAPVVNWQSVASSADGARLVAAAELNQVIYTSTNSGATWTQAANAPKVSWFSVTLSAGGTKLAAVADGSTNIFTSPDFGTTWITNNVPAGPPQGIQRGWSSIASSANGSKLIAATGGNGVSGFIFLSTNSGAAWKLTATNIPSGLIAHPWIYVASSADGSTLAAVSDTAGPLGVVITSTNSGATWTTNAVPFLDWNAVALSADGAKLVASVGYPSTGPIYVSQTTRAPVLSLSASDNSLISWMVPSLNFTLQQSSDLSNWTDMTNVPVLNFTNLENQVALPSPVGTCFFRLKH